MVHMTWVQPRVLDLNQVNENTFNCAICVIAYAMDKNVLNVPVHVVSTGASWRIMSFELLRWSWSLFHQSSWWLHVFPTCWSDELCLFQRCCSSVLLQHAICRSPFLYIACFEQLLLMTCLLGCKCDVFIFILLISCRLLTWGIVYPSGVIRSRLKYTLLKTKVPSFWCKLDFLLS